MPTRTKVQIIIERCPVAATRLTWVSGSSAKPPISPQLRAPTFARSSNHKRANSQNNGGAITEATSQTNAPSESGAIAISRPERT